MLFDNESIEAEVAREGIDMAPMDDITPPDSPKF